MSTSSPPLKTTRHRWFDHLLAQKGHGSVKTFVLARRIEGKSWREISRLMREVLDGEDITDQTLWTWFRGDTDVQAASAVGENAAAS